jgi:hypothetical protein
MNVHAPIVEGQFSFGTPHGRAGFLDFYEHTTPALEFPASLTRIIHEQQEWDRHLACLPCPTGWKPIPRVYE